MPVPPSSQVKSGTSLSPPGRIAIPAAQSHAYADLQNRPALTNRPAVYHHTPDIGLTAPADWCALEYAAPDHSRGYAGVFRLADGPAEYRLRLRGVDRASRYEVTLDNHAQSVELPSWDLAQDGLTISLDSPLTSELVLYRQLGTPPSNGRLKRSARCLR